MLKRVFSALLVGFCLFLTQTTVLGATTDISIVQTTDMNGHLFKDIAKSRIGYGNVLSVKAALGESLVVDSGNFLGDVTQKLTDINKNVIYAMNSVNYDCAVLGTSDLKYNKTELDTILKDANFKILGANIKYNGEYPYTKEFIKSVNGFKIGIFGITDVIEGTDFEILDPLTTATDCVNSLKNQGANTIVAVVHSKDKEFSEKVANSFPQISVVAEGGTRYQREKGDLIARRCLVINSGEDGKGVGVTKETFTDNVLTSIETSSYNLTNITQIYPTTNQLEQELKKAQQNIDEISKNVIATLPNDLAFNELDIHTKSTPLGNYVADAIRDYTKVDIAFVSSILFQNGLSKNVTQGEINVMMKDNPTVIIKEIDGNHILKSLETAINKIVLKENNIINQEASLSENFLQVSGLKVKYNPANQIGRRIISVTLDNGKKISWVNGNKKYKIASTTSVFEGNNKFLNDLKTISKSGTVAQIIEKDIKDQSIKISDENRVETTTDQVSYLWVIWLVAGVFVILALIAFIVARIMIYVSSR